MERFGKMIWLISVSIFLAIFCLGYYSFAVSYAGFQSSFLWFWLLAGIGFLLVTIMMVLHRQYQLFFRIPVWIRIVLAVLFGTGLIVFGTMEGLIFSKMQAKGEPDAEYVVVLGAQVRGTRITKSLRNRLDAAYDYLLVNKEAMVVCTGGKGSGEDIAEARAMSDYLMARGIIKDRILIEDRSTSTRENFKYAMALIRDRDAKIVVVTNNFHVYRAVYLAKQAGFTKVKGLAASSDHRLLLNYMVREGLALCKDFVIGRR